VSIPEQTLDFTITMNLLSMGLATTPAFRRKFMALNRVLDKRARYWRTDIFRQDFCSGKHYRLRIGGKIKRFAVPWVFPVEYRLLGDKKPQLLDMAISPTGAERFRKVLESKGQPIQPPGVSCARLANQHSIGRGLINAGKYYLRHWAGT